MEKFNIVLWPEGKLMPKIKKLGRKLSKISGKYQALKVNPHFTLMTTFKTSKIAEIIKEIKGQNFKRFTITLRGPVFDHLDFVWFKAEKKYICTIHKKIIEIVYKYKSSWILPEYKKIKLNKKQKEYMKKYSFPYVYEYFLPHMALAGFNFNKKRLPKIKEATKKQVKIKMPIKNLCVLTKKRNKWYLYRKITLR